MRVRLAGATGNYLSRRTYLDAQTGRREGRVDPINSEGHLPASSRVYQLLLRCFTLANNKLAPRCFSAAHRYGGAMPNIEDPKLAHVVMVHRIVQLAHCFCYGGPPFLSCLPSSCQACLISSQLRQSRCVLPLWKRLVWRTASLYLCHEQFSAPI